MPIPDIDALYPLPAFSWTEVTHSQKHQDYLFYYGIDFAQRLAVDHHYGVKALGGYQVAVHYFKQQQTSAKGSVVLIHGYMDHVGLYNHLLNALLHSGFNVLSYDLPGHGLSSGEQAGIQSFAEYQHVLQALMAEAKDHLPRPWQIVGQSTGGAIAMDYVLHESHHGFEKLALMAPLVRPKRWWFIRLQLALLGNILSKVPRSFNRNSADDVFHGFLKYREPLQTRWIKVSWVKALKQWQEHFLLARPCTLPTLIVQGHADVTVDWEYNVPQIRKKFLRLNEKSLERANHHLVKETESLRQQAIAYVLEFLQTEP